MTTMVGLYVEFKAKSKEVDETFKRMSKEIDNLKGKQTSISSGFNNMTNKVLGLGKSILNYGKWVALGITAAATGLWILIGKIADSIDAITDTARGLGVTAQALQSLGYAASLSGVSMGELEMSMKKLNVVVGQALDGNAGAIESFKKIGISAADLKGLSLDQQFTLVADAISKMSDKNLQASVAMEFFSRSYTSALNMIRDGVTSNIKEFDKLGLALTDNQRIAVDAFGDSKNRLGAIWEGFSQKVVGYVSPAFTQIIDFISNTILKMGGIDEAAQSFAKSIVSGVRLAVMSVNTLLNMLSQVAKVFTFISGASTSFQLKNAQLERRRLYNTERSPQQEKALSQVDKEISQLEKEQGSNYNTFNSIEKFDAQRNQFINDLTDTLQKAGSMISPVAQGSKGVAAGFNQFKTQNKSPMETELITGGYLNSGITSLNAAKNPQTIKLDISVTPSKEFNVNVSAISNSATTAALQIAAKSMGTK